MSAQLLPNGRQQFVDQNGNPLVSGLVYFYVPNTTTPKNTWQDAGETVLNTNPIILDARGQATIFGSGDYRQVLTDAAGNTIWDKNISTLELASNADVEAGTDTTKAVTSAGVWDWFKNALVFVRDGTSATGRKLASVLYANVPVNIEDFGGSTAIADNTAALNAAAAYCVAKGRRRIYFPGRSQYYFTSAPDAFTCGIILESDSPRTWLIRNYSPVDDFTPFLQWKGGAFLNTDDKSGGGLRDIGVYANDGTMHGCAVVVTAPSTANVTQLPGYMSFENVVISGGGTWGSGVFLDGSLNQDAGGQGIRDIKIDGITIFKCTNVCMQITNGVHILGDKIATFPETNAVAINVTGSGTALTNSNDVVLSGLDCSGDVAVQNAVDVVISGIVRGNVDIIATATRSIFNGVQTGSYTNGAYASDVAAATSASGNVTLPNGLRLQWKTVTVTTATTQQTFALPSSFLGANFGVWFNFSTAFDYSSIAVSGDTANWYVTLSSAHAAIGMILFAIGK